MAPLHVVTGAMSPVKANGEVRPFVARFDIRLLVLST